MSPQFLIGGAVILIVIAAGWGVYQFRKDRKLAISLMEDDPTDGADNEETYVKFGQDQCIQMTFGQKKYIWDPMSREQKRAYLKKHATLIKGDKNHRYTK